MTDSKEKTSARTQTVLPRWRGFNLLEMFTPECDGDFQEDDFSWIADWGFDFVRLPACYTLWTEEGNASEIGSGDRGVQNRVNHICFVTGGVDTFRAILEQLQALVG